MPYQLVPAAPRAQAVKLDKAVILFGRHPDCDVVITSSRKVSRKHCCVAQVDHVFVVRDLGSMNGIRVNGRAVKRSQQLRVGDELCVGDVVFHFRELVVNGAANGKKRDPQKSSPPARKPVPPHMISQDMPVIIPDEAESFVVEESIVKSPTDAEMPIPLSAADPADDSEYEIVVEE